MCGRGCKKPWVQLERFSPYLIVSRHCIMTARPASPHFLRFILFANFLLDFKFFIASCSIIRCLGTLAPRIRSHVGSGSGVSGLHNAISGGGSNKPPLFAGRIDIVNVTFAYPSRPEARSYMYFP